MRTSIIIAWMVSLLTGCGNDEAGESQIVTPSSSVISSQDENSEFELSGIWVNKTYKDKLEETKSPRIAQDASEITFLIISGSDKSVTMIYNYHEGVTGELAYENNGYKLQFDNSDEYSISSTENAQKLRLNGTQFEKAIYSDDDHTFDLIEQIVFAGDYDLNGEKITFTHDGQIKGDPLLTEYTVVADYLDIGLDVDQLYLGNGFHHDKLGFKFVGDTLRIYELKCLEKLDDQCMQVDFGEQVYELVKK